MGSDLKLTRILEDAAAGGRIVFVPGIMASALKYRGPGSLGNVIEDFVWSEDIFDILSEHKLERLAYPTPSGATVRADHVIQHVSVYGLPLVGQDIYGPLVKYLSHFAGTKNTEFSQFPYDWRMSIRISAAELIEELLEKPSSKHIALIGHSMGGLVCRLALASSDELRKRVRLQVFIATPFRGSIRAFRTLKISPSLNMGFDRLLWSVLHLWDLPKVLRSRARLFDILMDKIRTFPSVYELLPPEDVPALVTLIGENLSCVDAQVWPEHLQAFVQEAKKTQKMLAESRNLDTPMFVVYSASRLTDQAYMIRGDQPRAQRLKVQERVFGDGTVTAHSATHDCPHPLRYLEVVEPNDHLSLCRNPLTLGMVQYLLSTPSK
jgi:pimeloyl-ACP methyl ester carboxylesterase